MSLAETEQNPPRRTVPLKPREVEPRHPGGVQAWKRLEEEQSKWGMLPLIGASADLGSQLGLLHVQRHISDSQADAAVFFAKFCAKYDHYNGLPRRDAVSPAYESGSSRNSRNDEEALANLNGTIKEFERRCRQVRKRWNRIHGYIEDEKVFSLLLDVCVHNRHCPVMQIPVLRAALEILVLKLGLNRIRPEDQPRMQPKRKRFKPKQRDQNDRHRDPSSYYNRDAAPAPAVPVPQGGGSSQD